MGRTPRTPSDPDDMAEFLKDARQILQVLTAEPKVAAVGCELEEKERFWSVLDEVMESIPTGERVVIGADFNGHVGEGNTGDEEVMGKFGVKERNLEGQMKKRSKIEIEKKTKWWKLKKEECCEEFRQKLSIGMVRGSLGGGMRKLAKKKWDMDRTEENRQEYKELQRRVNTEVSKAKQKAYDKLYTRVLTSEESVQRRWKEYFEELMNEENEREKRVEGVNSVEQKVDKIRKDEVRKALKRMKSGKAVGPDDIPVEYRDGQRELHCVFVNLEKAYDRVPREELWYCMRKSGVAEKYVRVVQDMYERSRTVVRCAVVMDQLSEEVRQESPWTMMFADDIVICGESREQVEENLERWRFALERRGMKVSRSKTEYMCVNEREGSGTVMLQGEEVKKVQEFKYLGSTVQSNGESGKEVKKRVQAGWNGWRKVSGVLCDKKISARIKGKVYRTVVRPAMLYGLETVSLRKRQESELEVAELKMLRFSLGVTRLDRIRNEYIRGTAHVGRLGDKVSEAILRWFGHVQRRENPPTTPPFTEVDVRQELSRCKIGKAMGPDSIPARVLKLCAMELSPVFYSIMHESYSTAQWPTLWKNSTIIPLPKKPRPLELNHYRPVALTAIASKCYEKLILRTILSTVNPQLDKNQFAYKARQGTEDAVVCLLHSLLQHLEVSDNFAAVLFVDLSSAFNTIQRHQMIKKLHQLNVAPQYIHLIHSFLSNRPQAVRIGSVTSDTIITNTGAPQGCVLSPFLYTLYTNDCISPSPFTTYYKYSDDTAILALLNDHTTIAAYHDTISHFTHWCTDNFLHLNVEKTNELVFNAPSLSQISIHGNMIEQVEKFKYLGLTLDNKLTFDQ
ncbi:hypothetical protein QTP86_002555 [Hemibagrus guttatus]|nr:hypothetical protein QTP86_002555 [Hemibagrus guttatus]